MADATILIVEDEEKMRRLFDLVLRPEGYHLLQADSGEAALKLLEEGGVDLVLTDLQMAKVSRLEGLEHVTKDYPELPVVIITGYGTGKELLARAIHYAGPRAGGPMIAINCAALPELLLESELFGYEKGAFTDARKAKPGRLLLAHRGTLFLDEIDEMSHAIQAKLLRVLEDHMIEPLGGVKGVKVDLRLLVATNQELRDLVQKGKFREDLFYRVSVCQLHLPPLRERRGDIPVLLEHFLAQYRRGGGARDTWGAPSGQHGAGGPPWAGGTPGPHHTGRGGGPNRQGG